MGVKPKIIFFITEDWYFWSHRLPLARAARDAGFEVVVATRIHQHGGLIVKEGFKLVPLGLRRKSRNVIRELSSILEIIQVYRREKPDIVHHVAMKPVVYGTIASRIAGTPSVVNALAGMGHVFTSEPGRASLMSPLFIMAFRLLFKRPSIRIILQNPDDREMLIRQRASTPGLISLIRGSGVDVDEFAPRPFPPDGTPLCILPSRMLWDKGVGEYVQAATILKTIGIQARFALVGDSDLENPTSISRQQLMKWRDEGYVEWWGHREDMPETFAQSHIVCLPSYREGAPKALIEAAACGRPIITTDVPGCREVVRNGENGTLVQARDARALAQALEKMIKDPDLRRKMGDRGREIAVAEFSQGMVIKETLSIYKELLGS